MVASEWLKFDEQREKCLQPYESVGTGEGMAKGGWIAGGDGMAAGCGEKEGTAAPW